MSPFVMAVFGGTITFTLVTIALFALARASGASQRLAESTARGSGGGAGTSIAHPREDLRADVWPGLSEKLEETRLWQDLQLLVLRAGLLLRPSEALVIGGAAAVLGVAIGWFATGTGLLAFLGGALAVGALYLYLMQMAARRQAQLTSQLPNALDMLSSGLRSGHALTRSLRIVATQSRSPMSDEIEHVLQDINVGVSTPDAFDLLVARTKSYDIELVVAAIQTQLKLGGNLAEVLDNIASVIRERVRLQREIDAATSEGRLSATILVAMPFVMAMLISVISPGYLEPLFTEAAGKMMMIAAGVLMVIGIIVIKNLIEIDF
ncbi:MAG: type II secretion system F family protein [Armatimonadota bacterium]|jgi:tight adherence protein B